MQQYQARNKLGVLNKTMPGTSKFKRKKKECIKKELKEGHLHDIIKQKVYG